MSFTVIDAPQRSDAWFESRRGRLTGSRAKDMLSTIRTGEAAARRNYRIQIVLERITGKIQDSDYVSPAMQQGIDREPDARLAYEAATGQLVTETGFASHDDIMAGVSVDGYMDDWAGILELKCPNPPAHLEMLTNRKVPKPYMPQVAHGLWVTGAKWLDFASFNCDFPQKLQLITIRVHRTELDIDAHEASARQFLSEVDAETTRLRELESSV